MDLVIICAGCSAEFKASADAPLWTCTACGRESENKRYPFLTGRVAHAKSNRATTHWEEMFDELLAAAHDKVVALEARVARLEAEQKRRGGSPPGGP